MITVINITLVINFVKKHFIFLYQLSDRHSPNGFSCKHEIRLAHCLHKKPQKVRFYLAFEVFTFTQHIINQQSLLISFRLML